MSLLLITLLSSGCDTVETTTPHSILFKGVEHTVEGQATLALTPDRALAVSTTDGEGGVDILVAGKSRGDFIFKPVSVRPGGVFSLDLVSHDATAHQTLAQIIHRGLADGTTHLEADFSHLGARTAALTFYDQGKLVYTQPDLKVSDLNPLISVGVTMQEPTSYHYEVIQEGDETIIKVVVDYENEASLPEGPTSGLAGTTILPSFADAGPIFCTHVAFVVRMPRRPVSIHSVAMTGTGIGQITLVKERF